MDKLDLIYDILRLILINQLVLPTDESCMKHERILKENDKKWDALTGEPEDV